jgi:hypothetical protein
MDKVGHYSTYHLGRFGAETLAMEWSNQKSSNCYMASLGFAFF